MSSSMDDVVDLLMNNIEQLNEINEFFEKA